MNCAEFREELEAYSLGVLEPAEARRIEAHLRSCSECSQIVRAYHPTVDYLAFSAPIYRASPRVKDRIMGGIGALRPVPATPAFLSNRWFLGAASAALVFLAVGATVWATMLSSQVETLKRDNQALAELTQLDAEQRTALLRLQGDLNSAKTEQGRMNRTLDEQATLIVLALDPDLTPTEMSGTTLAPQAKCSYVWSSKQTVGALTCKDLPTTAFALTYELWVTKGDKTVPVGTFVPRFDGTAALLVKFPSDTPGPVNNLWVTLEQQGSAARRAPSAEVIVQKSAEQQAAR